MLSVVSNTSGFINFNGTGDVRALKDATMTFVQMQPQLVDDGYVLAVYGTGIDLGGTYDVFVTNNVVPPGGMCGYLSMEFNGDVANVAGNTGTIDVTLTDAMTGATETITTTYIYSSTSVITIDTSSLTFSNGIMVSGSPAPALTWTVNNAVKAGDKVLFNYYNNVNVSDAVKMDIKPVGDSATLAFNSLPPPAQGYILIDSTSSGAFTVVNIVDGEFVTSTVNWNRDSSNPTFSGTVVFGNLLKSDTLPTTMLKDVAQFTDSDGRMLLDNTRKLTLLGNNKTADIYLGKYNTVQELNDKLAYAIAITLEMGDPDVELSRLAHLVTAASSNGGNDAVKGTIVMQGAMTGRSSEIRFVADEDILRALSIEQIQQSKDDVIEMKVTDAHTGQYVNSDLSIDFMMRGVIKGVNIKLNPNITTSAKMDANGNIAFEQDAGLNPQYIHIANKETGSQIGANAGQYIDISVGRVDTVALEIDDAYLTTLPDAQRALFKIDAAIKNVVQQRAEIGSRINRMEYALKSLSIGQQNVLAASSRIRDIDMAKASADFTKNQIMMNAATSMLAQANQLPQMALQLINR
ncbi:hypothetical protein AGMMS49941_08360 [Deferribacterales bacterium]|nr:hypothetical protein AGMMS49941_08360 [Deferribacterales bacterium]